MIPLVWFLMAWLILMALFLFASFLTLLINLKYGLAGFSTYGSSLIFLGVSALTLIVVGSYFSAIDWSQTVNFSSLFASVFPF